VPEGIEISYHATVVNEAGEVVVVAIANSNIWRDVIAPLLPEGVDPDDPGMTLSLDSVYLPDLDQSIQIFAERPEVVTTEDAVWVRYVTLDGEEVLSKYDLPIGAFPVEAQPDLRYVRISLAWFSSDGFEFLPARGAGALPDGYFLPEPWGDGFIAASYELEASFAPFEDFRLWTTESGRAWRPAESQPPSECKDFYTASSGDRLLLSNDAGVHCVGTTGGEWKVLTETEKSSYVVGGPGGFVGYPAGYAYDTALFSRDGEHWESTTVPAAEPYPSLVPLENRLFMLSVDPGRPGVDKHIDLWTAEF